MFDFLRRSATSVFAWLILAVLALVFGLSFGLPTDAVTSGSSTLVKVFGERIDDQAYRVQYNLIRRFIPVPKDARFQQMLGLKEEVLETAIEREVLVEAGEQMGLQATDRDAEDLVANGHIILLGDTYDWLGDLNFEYDLFTNAFLRPLQTSEKAYLELQRREWLARTVRDLVEASVVVSDGELRRRYDAESNRLSLRYARFGFPQFAQLVDPTPEDAAAWLESHRKELELEFDRQGPRFLKLPPQVKVSVIEVRPPADATTSDTAASVDAIAIAAAARQRIVEGADFRLVAREVSTHATGPGGGSLGWITVKAGAGLGPEVDTAIADLGSEGLSPVLESEGAAFIVRVEGRREGDVPQDEALLELATEAAALAQGRALAEQAARETLAAVRDESSSEAVIAKWGELANDNPRIEVRETGLFAESEPVPALGAAPELLTAAWTVATENKLLDQVFTIGDAAVLALVERREEGTDEGFLAVRTDLYDEARREKAATVVADWAKYRCREAKDRGQINGSEERIARVMTYDTKEGEAPASKPYELCARVGQRGGLLRSGLFGRGRE